MIILAIDTSCDDTSISIIEVKIQNSKVKSFEILSNIVSSQVKLHAKYGGVYPFLAKREHQKNLPIVFEKALKRARISVKEIDFIAVTVGPGLEPCLWVGVNFVKELAKELKLPIIPVNHIEAHIFANYLTWNVKQIEIEKLFPAICLVVSGGHTQLILMKNFGNYKILGETRDDAAGECLDKVARILGLGYPGGPAIAAEAAKFKVQNSKTEFPFMETRGKKRTKFSSPFKVRLPRPMIYQKNYDFSFSGLKTAVLYDFKNRSKETQKSKIYKMEMARETQQAIIDVLVYKTLKVAKNFKARVIILGGGVAANRELRKQFHKRIKKELPNIQYLISNIQFCTDNAAMVGVAGYFHYLKGEKYNFEKIKANANLKIG